jgi:hypothetical protein
MTNAELVEIKLRCDTALEGPWFSRRDVITAALGRRVAMNVDLNSVQFITHARTDVPKLLEEIAQLKKSN